MENLWNITPFSGLYDKPPRDYTQKEAKANFDFLMAELPGRIDYFKRILAEDNIQGEGPSGAVLTSASEWIVARGKAIRVKSGVPRIMQTDTSEMDIDLATKSACCYFGYMFGICIFDEVSDLQWKISKEKRSPDFNLPVIYTPHGPCTLEPTGVAIGFVSGRIIDKRYSERFSVMYERWIRILKGDFSEFV